MADALTGNVADLVTEAAGRAPEHPALVDQPAGSSLTWRQVDDAVNAYAARVLEAGLRPGDRVAVALGGGARLCVALFGVLRAGGVLVPLSTDLPEPELRRVLSDSGARLMIGSGPDDGPASLAPPDLDAPAGGAPAPDGSARGGEDLAVLCYTSGTAGVPRGVMLSHRALLSNVEQCAALRPAPVNATDRVLLAVPLYHLYGLGPGLLQVAAAGATAVLMDRFSTEGALEACERHRVTAMVGVPPMYQAFSGVDGERLASALASMRLLTSGAAPLPGPVLAAIRQATGLSVFEGYGLTETGPVLTSTLVGGYAKAGSVGRPIPGVELRLVDSDGRPLISISDPDEPLDELDEGEESETGLVSVRGPNLFSGYWPDGAHGPDEEGWFRTGDVGYLDADGDLHLVDRANDLIIVNGFNVYPHEVERVLDELSEVAESAAVGVPDERTGERVKAVVVLRPGAELTEQAVREHCEQRLAKFKVPDVVEFVDALPHSVTGKLRRASLRGTPA
ncbi:MAG TPA: AMP-binding protein [Actinophytocola sp.]|uniref:AMP-binding protein n=1 Tax=Actinophytocola sp. TaxID=1872138 RepID=UPI002DDCB432|nr:AMP-binding protein [Actinophytocola sp.]HEV2779483.1 AMP-binding protein [Actinophytocola sp.]